MLGTEHGRAVRALTADLTPALPVNKTGGTGHEGELSQWSLQVGTNRIKQGNESETKSKACDAEPRKGEFGGPSECV